MITEILTKENYFQKIWQIHYKENNKRIFYRNIQPSIPTPPWYLIPQSKKEDPEYNLSAG